MGELRESKKRETRQRLSDVATELFYARGFDAVTVDEIAAAANVSKMTVFNYFARKEDLFLDREDDIARLLRETFADTSQSQSPVDALRYLVDRLIEKNHPFVRVDEQTIGWWRIVAASMALKARVREIGDEAVDELTTLIGGPKAGGDARLVAGMLVTTWRTAYAEAFAVFERGGSAKKTRAAFVTLIDRGFDAVRSLT